MKDNNHISIIGRVVKDATLKEFNEGFGVIQFSICSNTSTKKDGKFVDQPNFFSVKHRGKNLQKLTSFLTKGKQIAVEGFLTQESWEKDGKKNSAVVISSTDIQLVGGKSDSSSSNSPSESYDSSEDFGPNEDIPF